MDLRSESAKFEFCFPDASAFDLSQNALPLLNQKPFISSSQANSLKRAKPGIRSSQPPVVSTTKPILQNSIFLIPVFPLPLRNPTRLYAIALDLAKEVGIRDSYTLFHRNPDMLSRLWASENEKNWLYSLGYITTSSKNRDISLVDITQAISKYAVNIIKPGVTLAQLERFMEDPNISDLLSVSEFESMKSFGLIPDGFLYTPKVKTNSDKAITIDTMISGANTDDNPQPKKNKLQDIIPDTVTSSGPDSASIAQAISSAIEYNQKIFMYSNKNRH